MNCREWESEIALLVDGDAAAFGLAEHLEDCAECRKLLHGLRADQESLRRAPEIAAAVCDVVRDSALQRTARWTIEKSQWATAGAVAAAILLTGIWLRREVPPAEPIGVMPTTLASSEIKPSVMAQTPRAPKSRRRVRAAKSVSVAPSIVDWERVVAEWFPAEKKPALRGSQSEVAMHIQTSNPDVVILWLKEERSQ